MKKIKKTVSVKMATPLKNPQPIASGWTFLTNQTHVLLCLYRDPTSTTREVASLVGITERMVQKIVAELVESGYMEVGKIGRRNTYLIHVHKTLRHPLESHRRIGDLLEHLKKGDS